MRDGEGMEPPRLTTRAGYKVYYKVTLGYICFILSIIVLLLLDQFGYL